MVEIITPPFSPENSIASAEYFSKLIKKYLQFPIISFIFKSPQNEETG
jgi:hypothetical protein